MNVPRTQKMADLKQKIERLNHEVSCAHRDMREAVLESFFASNSLRIGDVVQDRRGARFKVCEVVPSTSGYVNIRAFVPKKDGSFGVKTRMMYWELEQLTKVEDPQ